MNMPKLDELDRKILDVLQDEGRITNSALAKRIGLTTTPTAERVRRLEREGVIDGYGARINAETVERGLTVFCSITLTMHQMKMVDQFCDAVEEMPEVLACYHITGDADFLLHVVVKDTNDYERFMRKDLTHLPGVQKIHTNIVLSTKKERGKIPVNLTLEDRYENGTNHE
ncbi:MAG: Lrp/AsnC family transcriptional regulator [Bacteroidota bacterium]